MKRYSRDDHVALAAWALDCAERVLPLFEREHPDDSRPRDAIAAGRDWVRTGAFRMASIRGASLAAHAAAKVASGNEAACQAAHAAGQAVATAHVAQHAYGGAYYALRALAEGGPDAVANVEAERVWQAARLPGHLRDEIMSRLIVEPRGKGLRITIDKGPGF